MLSDVLVLGTTLGYRAAESIKIRAVPLCRVRRALGRKDDLYLTKATRAKLSSEPT